jgi:hypothetical protein
VYLVEKKLIVENRERLSVLNDRGKIDNMVVFLAYRKLRKMLAASSSAYTCKIIEKAQGK